MFGAEMASGSKMPPRTRMRGQWTLTMGRSATSVDMYCGARISIGDNVTVYLDPDDPAHAPRTGGIRVGDEAWVAADSLVLAGAEVSDGTVVGARSLVPAGVVTEPWAVSAGQPARALKARTLRAPSGGAT